jgi:fructose-1,6-bisphosphatase I
MTSIGITLSRHILEEERRHPEVSGELSVLLDQIGFAAKILSREIGRAALVGKLGLTGESNVTGDAQKKLDVFGNETIVGAFAKSALVAGIISEEMDEIKQIAGGEKAKYVLCIDPIDGSSNIDINGSLGTIFGFYRCGHHAHSDFISSVLCPGSEQVLAGYVLYSTSTMLIYTIGHAVHGFTLDRELGEFLLSHENIRCPERGASYSANLGRHLEWDRRIQDFVHFLTQDDPSTGRPYSLRYSGAFVADFHRCLLEGGCYFYPPDRKHSEGKLRLLYECAPLAFVAEQAGGRASTGDRSILQMHAEAIHQRSPLIIGSREDVLLFERFLAGEKVG